MEPQDVPHRLAGERRSPYSGLGASGFRDRSSYSRPCQACEIGEESDKELLVQPCYTPN
jgi:hypothetical protein